MNTIDVTVIVPIYNTKNYLYRCFHSIIKALGSLNYEVLLLDDGSTDGSGEYAEWFAKEHEGFRYRSLPHCGQGRIRNIGIEEAKGKYIQFTDSDSYLIPGLLEDMYHAAEHDGSDVVLCNSAWIRDDRIVFAAAPLRCFSQLGIEDRVTDLTKTPELLNDLQIRDKLIRRDLFADPSLRFEEETAFEDLPVSVRLYHAAKQISVVRTRGVLKREQSKKEAAEGGALADHLKMTEEAFRFLDEKKAGNKVRSVFERQTVLDHIETCRNALAKDGKSLCVPIDGMSEQLRTHISPGTIGSLSLIDREIVQALTEQDKDRLNALLLYKRKKYSKVPVKRESDRFVLDLPEDLFPDADRDARNDFFYSVPNSHVRMIESGAESLTVIGHLYHKRISLTDSDEMQIRVFLVNERTGAYREAKVERIRSDYLTEEQSSNGQDLYCYDEAGFRTCLDLSEAGLSEEMEGKNVLLIGYRSPVSEGWRVLRGVSQEARFALPGLRVLLDGYHLSVYEEMDGTPVVWIRDNAALSGKEIIDQLKEENDSLTEEVELLLEANEKAVACYQETIWERNDLKHEKEKLEAKLEEKTACYDRQKKEIREIRKELEGAKKELAGTRKKLDREMNSWNYRVGAKITAGPKKIRNLFRRKK